MARGQKISVIRWLRGMVCTDSKAETDQQLLERFIRERDEDAFTTILKRHGPMVLGVCRRILGNAQEAEDAFQATFLILLRQVSAVRWQKSASGWLYEVARQVAIKAGMAIAKRRQLDQERLHMPETLISADANATEMRILLDEEVQRLPAKFRDAVVLCYLEGKTYEEASRQLGVGTGMVSKRLAKARDLLRSRLARRGAFVSASAVALAAASQATAAVTPSLTAATLEAVVAAAGKGLVAGAVSTSVAVLVKSVTRAMFWSKVKTAAVVLLTTAVIAAGGGAIAYQAWSADVPSEAEAPKQAEKPLPETAEPPLQQAKRDEPIRPTEESAKPGETRAPCFVASSSIEVALTAQVRVKKDAYALDLGGLSAEEFLQRVRAANNPSEIPDTPTVDLELELKNVGKEPLMIRMIGENGGTETPVPEVRLAAGEVRVVPLRDSLGTYMRKTYFYRGMFYRDKSGKYVCVLPINYFLSAAPVPKNGAVEKFRAVQITAAVPLHLSVNAR